MNPFRSLLQTHRTHRLTTTLSKATRVNPPPKDTELDRTDYVDYTDTKRNRLFLLLHDSSGDGLWKCCNGHEQELVHWSGPHPFKHLSCIRCDHILCVHCCTTSILGVVHANTDGLIPLPSSDERANHLIHYGQVCPTCGLSHRAQLRVNTKAPGAHASAISFHDVLCPCGCLSDKRWMQFKIGSVAEYRRDPLGASAELTRMRAERSVGMRRRVSMSWSPKSPVRVASKRRVGLPGLEGGVGFWGTVGRRGIQLREKSRGS